MALSTPNADFKYFNSVYSKRMPHLDFIDLMKSDDFEKGGSNADEYQNMKNTKADETQKFYKMFWILKNFGLKYSRKKFD